MLAAILVVALGLRVWSLRHGLPFVFNVDEEQHFVSKAARFFSGGDLDPGYFENPPGLTYLLWAAFAVRYAGEDVRSLFHNDPGGVYLTGRLVVAVLGTAVVAATYSLGSRLAHHRHAGLVAAGLMAVGFIPVWYSKLALNDMPAVLPATLAVVFALRHLDEGRRRDLLIAGLMAGLAAGTKYTAGAAFLAVIVAGAPRLKALLLAALAALAGAILLNPWFVLDPVRIYDAMHSQGERSSVAKVGGSDLPAPIYYLDSFTWGLGLPAALLAVAGLVLAAREGPRRLATVAVPALVLLIAISLFDRAFARWALPAYPLVASLAGLAVARGAARLPVARRHGGRGGRAGVHPRRDRDRAPEPPAVAHRHAARGAPVPAGRDGAGDEDRDRADAAVAAHDQRPRRQAVLGAGPRLRRAAEPPTSRPTASWAPATSSPSTPTGSGWRPRPGAVRRLLRAPEGRVGRRAHVLAVAQRHERAAALRLVVRLLPARVRAPGHRGDDLPPARLHPSTVAFPPLVPQPVQDSLGDTAVQARGTLYATP